MTQPYTPPPGSPPPASPPPAGGWQSPDYYTNMQVDRDAEHLKILSICWYVASGLGAVMGCIPIIHVVLGIIFLASAGHGGPGAPPAFFGLMFILMGSAFILFLWTGAILAFITARSLKARRRIVVCYIAAGMACLQIPIGITLGIFTFVVLARPSIKASFT